MRYSTKLISNGRWGIYEGHTLLATIGCRRTCHRLIAVLNQRHYDKQLTKTHPLQPTTQSSDEGIELEAESTVKPQKIAQVV